jgi:hypothetical protein
MPTKPPNELIVSEEAVPTSTVIWRYYSLERFVDVLKTHSLWFSRPFAFPDLWEGLFPPSYLKRTRQYAKNKGIPFEEFDRDFQKRILIHRCAHFVNCWHIAWFRDEGRPAWAKALRWAPRAVFKDGLRYLQKTGDSTFKPVRLRGRQTEDD